MTLVCTEEHVSITSLQNCCSSWTEKQGAILPSALQWETPHDFSGIENGSILTASTDKQHLQHTGREQAEMDLPASPCPQSYSTDSF